MQLDQRSRCRFIESFIRRKQDQCWEWTGPTTHAGYPLFSNHGQTVSALKVLYGLYYNRRVPKGWIITHTCRQTKCMNPGHLYITKRSELTTELYASGQMKRVDQKGAKNPNAKLTKSDVKTIRREIQKGATYKDLADKYGVTKSTISMIYHRTLWSHVK